LLGYH